MTIEEIISELNMLLTDLYSSENRWDYHTCRRIEALENAIEKLRKLED